MSLSTPFQKGGGKVGIGCSSVSPLLLVLLIYFILLVESFLCIWENVLSICSLSCLSCPWFGNFYYLDAYIELFPSFFDSLRMILFTYVCKTVPGYAIRMS